MVVVMPLWFKRVFPAQHSHMPLLCAGIWSGRSFSIPPLTNHTRSLICSFQHMQNCFLQGWHLMDLLMTYTELGFVRLCRIRPSNGNKKKLGKVNNGIKNISTQSCLLTAIFHWQNARASPAQVGCPWTSALLLLFVSSREFTQGNGDTYRSGFGSQLSQGEQSRLEKVLCIAE